MPALYGSHGQIWMVSEIRLYYLDGYGPANTGKGAGPCECPVIYGVAVVVNSDSFLAGE